MGPECRCSCPGPLRPGSVRQAPWPDAHELRLAADGVDPAALEMRRRPAEQRSGRVVVLRFSAGQWDDKLWSNHTIFCWFESNLRAWSRS
jgi:hypothetical protein